MIVNPAASVHSHGSITHSHAGGGTQHAHAQEGFRAHVPGSYYQMQSGTPPAPTDTAAATGGAGNNEPQVLAIDVAKDSPLEAGPANEMAQAAPAGPTGLVPPTGEMMDSETGADGGGGVEYNDAGEPIGAPEPTEMTMEEAPAPDEAAAAPEDAAVAPAGGATGGLAGALQGLTTALTGLSSALKDLMAVVAEMYGVPVPDNGAEGGGPTDEGADVAGEMDMGAPDDATGAGPTDMSNVEAPADMSVSVNATQDAMDGYNLIINTEGFEWAPHAVNGAHQAGQGHAHLYIDGEMAGRLYGSAHHLTGLTPGDHEIKVVLTANTHGSYTREGEELAASTVITV